MPNRSAIEAVVRARYMPRDGGLGHFEALLRKRGLSILTDEALRELAVMNGAGHRRFARHQAESRAWHAANTERPALAQAAE